MIWDCVTEIGQKITGLLSEKEILAGLIGASATVVVGWVGFHAVLRQAREQARKALFLDVYKAILEASVSASTACHNFRSAIARLESDVSFSISEAAEGRQYPPSTIRVEGLMDLQESFARSLIRLSGVIERWRIVDPRVRLFNNAFGDVVEVAQDLWRKFFFSALLVAPRGSGEGWKPPSAENHKRLKDSAEPLADEVLRALAYLMDCETEMQKLLLGELFKHTIKGRLRGGSGDVVLVLDKADELIKHFEAREVMRRSKGSF